MASVTFPPALGGDGSTVTDDSSPTTGLASGGHRTRFVPALAQAVAVMSGAVTQAGNSASAAAASQAAAAASAASAVNSPGTSATSTTSLAVGTGSKTLTVQTGKSFVVGHPVMIARTSDAGNTWMAGNVTAYNSGTGVLTVNVVWTSGSGTWTDWTIGLAGPANPAAVNRAGDTMTGSLTVPGLTVTGNAVFTGTADWRRTVVAVSGNTTATKSLTYVLLANATLTLPASPTAGDWVEVSNRSGLFTCTVARNGQPIMGLAEDMVIDRDVASFVLFYADATRGWVLI